MMTSIKCSFTGAALMGIATVLMLAPRCEAATIGFKGTFDESNFTSNFTSTDADNDGSVEIQGSNDTTAILTGPNEGGFPPSSGEANWFIQNVSQTSTVQFEWSFTGDPNGLDSASYLIGGQAFPLGNDGDSSTSPLQLTIAEGESFGFRVATNNNLGVPGELTISNFESESIPFGVETNTGILVLISGMGSIAWRRHRRRLQANQNHLNI
ncbi:hypothetical protein PCC7418_3787 [Halothece sp. PCC 7418]|uniref:hypothetical protein n=1 Tax=Halothece sp. (strain PCC 7418) TaxID=65093 RepID=UPI0002A068B9|nr:hypothetical protein [Halothece sp. PCC 7418]AFZ45891.1 hypothetical protein PCC7418_3787 [Halothece sp. PCC 7418]